MGLFSSEDTGGIVKSGDFKANATVYIYYHENYKDKAHIHIYTQKYNSWTGDYNGDIDESAKYSPDQIKYYKVLSQTQEQSYS